MDIFKGWVWYAYKENPMAWHKLTVEQASQILKLNNENTKVHGLEEYAMELELEVVETSNFTDGVGQDSLTRFDRPKYKKNRNKGNRNRNRNAHGNKKGPQKRKK